MQTKRWRCRERKKQDAYVSKLALLAGHCLSLLPRGSMGIIFKVLPRAEILLVRIACKKGTLLTNHMLN